MIHLHQFQAEKLGTKQLDEDGLFDLIRTLPGKKGSKSSNKSSPKTSKSLSQSLVSVENSFEDFDDDLDMEMAEAAEAVSNSCKVQSGVSPKIVNKKKEDEVFIESEVYLSHCYLKT